MNFFLGSRIHYFVCVVQVGSPRCHEGLSWGSTFVVKEGRQGEEGSSGETGSSETQSTKAWRGNKIHNRIWQEPFLTFDNLSSINSDFNFQIVFCTSNEPKMVKTVISHLPDNSLAKAKLCKKDTDKTNDIVVVESVKK